ncbi:Type 1 glutamine amidotransferase-like domain-containing protein [Streptococcus caprae]|uniref:Type 1 glutamine amidotransferase-like domain-containing protein n=1 Tax=Streptococcus caprae TaxID=1640501 RepID=A0ABV8CU63_9STRE
MKYFLASNPVQFSSLAIRTEYGFLERLRAELKSEYCALFICSAPDNPIFTDKYAQDMKQAFEDADLSFQDFQVLDRRNQADAVNLVGQADVIFLAGGHVPTQNAFFQEIGLAELLAGTDKIIIGTSAGSMNSASLVYAQPEEEGEAISSTCERFLPGLGLTDMMIVPHYQDIKDQVLDGMRIIEDITLPDSQGRVFHLLEDGAYLYGDEDGETLYGPVYLAKDGQLTVLQ